MILTGSETAGIVEMKHGVDEVPDINGERYWVILQQRILFRYRFSFQLRHCFIIFKFTAKYLYHTGGMSDETNSGNRSRDSAYPADFLSWIGSAGWIKPEKSLERNLDK
jgi:hypothetical protein